MKIKTAELVGRALDFAIAKAQGFELVLFDDLWRENASVKGYNPADVEQHLEWQPLNGKWVIVELRNLYSDQRHPEIATPTRCAVGIPDYSSDLAQAVSIMSIMEQEGIGAFKHNKLSDAEPDEWCAHKVVPRPNMEGSINMVAIAIDAPSLPIAAMRCFVASKLGYEVDIPDQLCEFSGLAIEKERQSRKKSGFR